MSKIVTLELERDHCFWFLPSPLVGGDLGTLQVEVAVVVEDMGINTAKREGSGVCTHL